MGRLKKELDYNKIYYNTQNKAFKIEKELEPKYDNNGKIVRKVLIRFIESGYETETFLSKLNNDLVPITDYLLPTVCGVGIVGYADPEQNHSMYKRWTGMIARCYDPDNHRYNAYGARGVRVCDRWIRFDYFLEDLPYLPGYQDMINNPDAKYELDKDILQQGIPVNQKVYSPTTCMFVPQTQNIIQRIIDNKQNCINTQYYGVQITEAGTYTVRIRVGNDMVPYGTYTNIIAAANVYNHYAKVNGKQLFNDVEYMDIEECMKYLVRPLQMLRDENKKYGAKLLKSGNYQGRLSINGKQEAFGVYTYEKAAHGDYDYYCIANGRPMVNNVNMSHEECAKYLVKPRNMCTIVDK